MYPEFSADPLPPSPRATTSTPPRRQPRRVRWTILMVAPLIAAGLASCATQPGTTATATTTTNVAPDQTSEPTAVTPTSVDALAALLITPTGRTGAVTTAATASVIRLTTGGNIATPGVQWGASNRWNYAPPGTDALSGSSGTIALSQYDTQDDATAARLVAQRILLGPDQTGTPVPGHPNAKLYVDTTDLNDHKIIIITGAAQAGTIVVAVYTVGETPDFTQDLLAQQLDKLT
jgi:hypothetical protein